MTTPFRAPLWEWRCAEVRCFLPPAWCVLLDGGCYGLGFAPALACRVGEASHPGPDEVVWFGTSNPSGLRGKESLLAELGCGVWCLSETQLSAASQRSVGKTLRYCCRAQGRQPRCHFGAPAPLRPGSQWAGSWTGVMTLSDFPSRSITVPFDPGLQATGRIQVVQHMLDTLYLRLPQRTHFSGRSHANGAIACGRNKGSDVGAPRSPSCLSRLQPGPCQP